MPTSFTYPASTIGAWVADDLNGTLNDADPVSNIDPQVGAISLTQSGSARPILKKDIVNGRSVLRFDGVDDFLDGRDHFDIGLNSLSVFVVARTAIAVTGKLVSKHPGSALPGFYILTAETAAYYDSGGLELISGADRANFSVYEMRLIRGDHGYYLIDRIEQGSIALSDTTTDLNTPADFKVGTDNGLSFLTGDIAAVIVCRGTGDIPTAERDDLFASLYEYYGLHPLIVSPVLPDGTVSTAYSQSIALVDALGSSTYAITSGSLPTGLSLNAATGLVSGTAPASPGASTFTVQATDAGGRVASATITLLIDQPITSFLVDSITAVPLRAYSPRKLRTAYAGSCWRVRRASDNTEQDIGFNANGWLDKAALASFALGTTFVITKWYDQMGHDDLLSNSGHEMGGDLAHFLNVRSGVDFSNTTVNGASMSTAGNVTTVNPKVYMAVHAKPNNKRATFFFACGPANRGSISEGGLSLYGLNPTDNGVFEFGRHQMTFVFTSGDDKIVVDGVDKPCLDTTVADTDSGNISQTGVFILGSYHAGQPENSFDGVFGEVILFEGTVSGPDDAAIKASQSTAFIGDGLPADAIAFHKNATTEGDSLTFGYGATTNPAILAQTALGDDWRIRNKAASQQELLTEMTADAAIQIDQYNDARYSLNALVIWAGINDFIHHITMDAATLYAGLQTYVAARKTAFPGIKVIVATITPIRSGILTTQQFNVERPAYNALVRANWQSFADGLCDLDAIAGLANTSDTSIYHDLGGGDSGLHFTDLAYTTYIGPAFVAALEGLLDAPRITTSVLRNGTVGSSYRVPIGTADGTAPRTISKISGSADVLVVDPNVVSDGPFLTAGERDITIRVTDFNGRHAQTAFVFDVIDPAAIPPYISGYETLQFCMGSGPAESIEFAVYESDLGDGGFETSTLYGPETGRKRWKVGYPVLSGASADLKVTASNGQLMTAADYVWDLYCRSRRSGRPFVIRSPRNGQYYLVKFANPNVEYTRFVTMLFATQLELKQMRVSDVSVFDPTRLAKSPWGWYRPQDLDLDAGVLADSIGSGHDLVIAGGVTAGGSTQNSLSTIRLDGSSGDLEFAFAMTLAEALMVVKYRGSTFSNNAPLLVDGDGSWAGLVGTNAGTKFADQSLGTTFTYRIGGIDKDADDQEAPMNEFALVHVRFETPVSLSSLRIGISGGVSEVFGAYDLGDIFLFDQLNTLTDIRELAEYMMTIWDL